MNICYTKKIAGEFSKTFYKSDFLTLKGFIQRVDMQRNKLKHCTFICDGNSYRAKFRMEEGGHFQGKKIVNAVSDAYRFIWRYKIIE